MYEQLFQNFEQYCMTIHCKYGKHLDKSHNSNVSEQIHLKINRMTVITKENAATSLTLMVILDIRCLQIRVLEFEH